MLASRYKCTQYHVHTCKHITRFIITFQYKFHTNIHVDCMNTQLPRPFIWALKNGWTSSVIQYIVPITTNGCIELLFRNLFCRFQLNPGAKDNEYMNIFVYDIINKTHCQYTPLNLSCIHYLGFRGVAFPQILHMVNLELCSSKATKHSSQEKKTILLVIGSYRNC